MHVTSNYTVYYTFAHTVCHCIFTYCNCVLIESKLNIFIIILFFNSKTYASKLDTITSIFPIVAHHCLLDCIGQSSSKITTCELRKLCLRVAAQTEIYDSIEKVLSFFNKKFSDVLICISQIQSM